METALQEHWFVLDSCPAIPYRAARFGADWNGWATPVITAPTLATDEAGRCTLQDHEGHIDILTPDSDGLYDLGDWIGHSETATHSVGVGRRHGPVQEWTESGL